MDYIDLPVGQHTFFVLATHPQFVAMFVEFDPIVDSSPSAARWQTEATAKLTQEDLEATNFGAIYSVIMYRHHPPIVTGPGQPLKVPTLSAYHWLIGLPVMYVFAIPLTLLSAWLLLSNPRTKPEAPIASASENA